MRVLANSVQKSGTHLLLRLLELLGVPRYPKWRLDPEWTLERSLGKRILMRPPGVGSPVPIGRGVTVSSRWVSRLLRGMPDDHALLAHCGFSPEISALVVRAGVRTICIVRDPRDVAVSHAHFLVKIGKSKILRKPEHQALLALPDHDARILELLRGHPGTPSVGERFREFLGWRDHPDVMFVRFEDLVGGPGGGDDDLQCAQITGIAQYLGVDLPAGGVDGVRAQLFGNTATFRKGTTGQWREEFGPEHLAAAREHLSAVIAELGYPPAGQ